MSITIYDIAKAADVSIATVSRVFNGSDTVRANTKEKVLKIADQMGYHPQAYAQGLASKKKNNLMMLVPVMSNYFFTEILRGIQDKLAHHKYELNIINIKRDGNPLKQVQHVLKRRWADGYLLVSLHLKKNQLHTLEKFNVPISLVDDYSQVFDSISFNNKKGGYLATRYFLEKGYRDIVYLSARDNSLPVTDRLEGFHKAMEEYNIPIDPAMVIMGDSMERDGFTEVSGYEAMKKILTMNPIPEACVCSSDIKAVGAMKAMREKGIDLPVISYDNLTIAEYIGLSTIHQPMYQMGYDATENLIDRINDPGAELRQKIHDPELIIRLSSEHLLFKKQKYMYYSDSD